MVLGQGRGGGALIFNRCAYEHGKCVAGSHRDPLGA